LAAVAVVAIAISTSREREAPAEPNAFPDPAQQELRPPATVLQDFAPTQAESNLATDERQLFVDFATAEAALNNSSDESFYLQQGDDPWRRKLESLKQELDEIESASSLFQ
jgi:hypothetical protein